MATGGSDNASDEIITFKCCVCVENKISREAEKYCVECQDYYCVPCSDVHKKFPLMKGHTLLDKDRFSTTSLQSSLPCFPTERCLVHKTKLLDIYCKTHDEVICATCFVVKHRTCEDILSIPDEVNNLYKESASAETIVKLTTARKGAEDIKDNRQHLIKRLKENRKKATNAIKDFSKEMEDKLKKLETESLKEVDAEYEKKESSLQNDIKRVEQHTADLDQSTDKLAKSDGNKAQKFVTVKISENYIKAMERKCFYKQDASYMKMDFFADLRIQNCLNNINTIGRLAVYEPRTTGHTVEQQRDINVRLMEDEESCCVSGSCSDGNDERRRYEDKIQNMIEEHKQSQEHALDDERKTMNEHYSNLNRERKQQHEHKMQTLQNLFESKLKNEKEERRDLINRMKTANEEKINRLMRDEQSRDQDNMDKMIEHQPRRHTESLEMQQKETARIRAEREQLRQKMKANEDERRRYSDNMNNMMEQQRRSHSESLVMIRADNMAMMQQQESDRNMFQQALKQTSDNMNTMLSQQQESHAESLRMQQEATMRAQEQQRSTKAEQDRHENRVREMDKKEHNRKTVWFGVRMAKAALNK